MLLLLCRMSLASSRNALGFRRWSLQLVDLYWPPPARIRILQLQLFTTSPDSQQPQSSSACGLTRVTTYLQRTASTEHSAPSLLCLLQIHILSQLDLCHPQGPGDLLLKVRAPLSSLLSFLCL